MTFIAPIKFAIDLLAVLLLALGIKGLSKVRSAREANRLAAIAMMCFSNNEGDAPMADNPVPLSDSGSCSGLKKK